MRTKAISFLIFVILISLSFNAFSLPTHLKNVVNFEHKKEKAQPVKCQCDSSKKQKQLDEMQRIVSQMTLTDSRRERIKLSEKFQSLLSQ